MINRLFVLRSTRSTSPGRGTVSGQFQGYSSILLVLCFVIVSASPGELWGQNKSDIPRPPALQDPKDQELNEEDEQILNDTFLQKENSVFIPAPREMVRPLIRANRAIRENEVARAVSLLGEVLSESTEEDYLVPFGAQEGLSVSLRYRAEKILGSLPPKDRELYRLRYGVQAKQMLNEAIENGEFEKVSQVMQRFFFTRSGFDAAMILGHYHLDEGRAVAAANCFAKICDSDEARVVHDPEASVLLAICWMLADSKHRAEKALNDLRSRYPANTTIQFQGRPVRLFSSNEDPTQWLIQLVGDSPIRNIQVVNQWVMAGGNPQRNATSGTGFPLLNARWSVPTLNDPDLEKAVAKRMKELIFLDSAPIPSVQPLAVGDTVIMRTYEKMIGVDFRTGKRKWVFPAWDFATQFGEPTKRIKPRTVNSESLKQRMWQDSLYGQSSSDGQRIFVVPNPGVTEGAASRRMEDPNALIYRPFNEIKAIDIAREGAFLWEVGGQSGLDEPKLAEAFFLGAPLPIQGDLYVACQQKSVVKLVVLDAETGRLKWEQAIGTIENSRDLRTDTHRRLAGVTPSFADGVVVCSTGTGALVAVDVATRTLLWGYQYMPASRRNLNRISPGKASNADPFSGLWRDSSIVISDGRVLYTPVDAQVMICVELQTGMPGFRKPDGTSQASCPRQDSLYLANVHNRNAILIGESSVRAVDINTGLQSWELPTTDYGKPSGRGYSNRGDYYLPTTAEKLVRINLDLGKLEKAVQTDGILGNLICFQGEVISHGVDRVAVFPQDEPNRMRLAAATDSEKISPDMLLLKSQLQIQDGKLREAVASLQESYRLESNRSTQLLLMKLILRLLEQDFDYGMQLVAGYEQELREDFLFEFLAAKINGMIQKGDKSASIEMLFDLLENDQSIKLDEESLEFDCRRYDGLVEDEIKDDSLIDRSTAAAIRKGKILVRLDRWIAAKIRTIYADGSADIRSNVTDRLSEYGKKYEGESATDLHDKLRPFGVDLIEPANRLALAKRLIEEGETLRSMQLLNSLTGSNEKAVAGQATSIMLELYAASGDTENSRKLAEQLKSEFGDVELGDGINGESVANDWCSVQANDETGSRTDWNNGRVTLTRTPYTRDSTWDLLPCVVELIECDDPQFANYKYRFYGQTGELEILDEFGASIHRFLVRKKVNRVITSYSNYVFGRISIKGNVAIADIGTEMFVIDLLKLRANQSNPVIWNFALQGGVRYQPTASVSRMWGETRTTSIPRHYENRVLVSYAGFSGTCYLDDSQLVCLDTFTGETLWQRSIGIRNSVIFGDQENLVLWNPKRRLVMTFEPSSGKLKRTSVLDASVGSIWKTKGTSVLVSAIQQVPGERPSAKTRGEDDEEDDEEESEDSEPKVNKMVGLYDLLTDEFVWQKTFGMTARGCGIGLDKLAILPPEGELTIIDFDTGKVDFGVPLSFGPKPVEGSDGSSLRKRITGMGVAVVDGKYLVHLKRGDTPNRISINSPNADIRYLSYNDVMWVGHLMCVDPESGSAVWDQAVQFDNFQIAQGQPSQTPLYFLVRRVHLSNESQTFIQFAAIDMSSGKLAFNYLEKYSYNVKFKIGVDPETQTVEIKYNGNSLQLKLEDFKDGPPRPLAHLTNSSSIPRRPEVSTGRVIDQLAIAKRKEELFAKAKKFQEELEARRERERKLLEQEK